MAWCWLFEETLRREIVKTVCTLLPLYFHCWPVCLVTALNHSLGLLLKRIMVLLPASVVSEKEDLELIELVGVAIQPCRWNQSYLLPPFFEVFFFAKMK